MTNWLYDTSIFVAMEDGRALGELPVGNVAVSVMTLGELQLGLQLAGRETLPHRLETIAEIEHAWTPLAADMPVVRRFATLVADARRSGFRPHVADAIIAATASWHGLGIVTQDRDFTRFAGLEVVLV
jgi:predicted nucleic acid-binding protein